MELEEALAEIEKQKEALATAERDNLAMKSKLDELLDETKKAKAERKAAEEAARNEAEELAAKKGDYESLLKTAQERQAETEAQLEALRKSMADEKRKAEGTKLSATLAEGDNVALLAEFVTRRLRVDEDGSVKVTDQDGNLTVSSLEDLGKEFSSDPRYASLLKGNQASGGGAAGGAGGGGATDKTLTRGEFESMDPAAQMKHIHSGGQVVDNH